jgi:hypothetical protein
MSQIDAEARKLAEQFLAEQGAKLEEKAADVSQPPTNILIAVPCFGGNVHYRTVNLLMGLTGCLSKAGIPHQTRFTANESLITRARNYLSSVATFSHDSSGRPFSHILFVDADVCFEPQYVLRMLDAKVPIIALPYSIKSLDFHQIAEAAKRGISPEQLTSFGGNPTFNTDKEFVVGDQPVPVRNAATGAMLISVEVLKALAAAYPERKYKSGGNYPHLEREVHDFFRIGIHDGEYYSEDYEFCADALGLRFHTFILPAKTEHTGSFTFVMDMHAVGALRGVLVKENAAQAAKE